MLFTSVGEAVKCGGCAGGGLDAAVEPSGEGALEPAADVPVRLALGGAFGYVGREGDRHSVEGTIEVPVAGAAQSV